jgi:hypothetical protein
VSGNGMYISTPYITYWEPIPETPRRGFGLFRRR